MRARRIALAGLAVLVLLVGTPVLYLSALDVNQFRGLLASEVERLTGRRLSIDGALELEVSLTPEVRATDVRLANPAWASGPDLISVERIDARVALLALLRGTVEIRRLAIVRPVLTLETDADGRRNWMLLGDGADDADGSRDTRLDFKVQQVSLEDVQMSFRDGRNGAVHSARARSLTLQARSTERLELALEGQFRSAPVSARGEIGRLRHLVRGEPYAVALALETPDARMAVDGALVQSADALAFAFVGIFDATLDDAASWTTLGARHLDQGTALDMAGTLMASEEGLELRDLSLVLGDSRATGALSATLVDRRPRVTGNLSVDRLDLAAPRAKRLEKARSKARANRVRIFSLETMNLAPLKAGDAVLDLRLGELAMTGAVLRDVRASITLEKGHLRVDPVSAGFLGSRASGTMSLDARRTRASVAIRLSAAQIPVRGLLGASEAANLIDGPANIALDVSARGNSVAALMGNLDGSVRLLIGDGRVRAGQLERLVGGVSALFGPPAEEQGDWTGLRCGAADFVVEDGVATPRVLLLDTDGATLVGEGDIDLGEETLSLKLTPYPKSLTLNLAVPVRVRGTFTTPSFSPDEMAVARRVGAVALMIFPPTALAGLGSLAVFGAGALGATGAAAHDSTHPCIELATGTPKPEKSADAPRHRHARNGEPLAAEDDASASFRATELLPTLSVGAAD
jgi:uncharacterized protein involved in outer membrane biogenesis